MFDLSWMAWTQPTAIFFIVIALLIAAMGVWEWLRPGGAPRRGLLGVVTTRGDRLFISLLAAAHQPPHPPGPFTIAPRHQPNETNS